MRKTIIFFSLILVANALFATITVDGYAYLENQTDHSGIEVFFERTAPSTLTYTVFTNASGYYTANIETGMYDITYSRNEYFNEWLTGQSLYSNTTLSDITLMEHTTLLNVPLDFATIQSAINYAFTADTVLVQPGTYFENINYNGKNITIASLFLTTQDTSYISQTIIDGNQNGSVVTFNGGSDNAVLSGFTIQNGSGSYGGGICCFDSSPSLMNVTITDNSTTGTYGYGGGIYFFVSNPSLMNVTITNNLANYGGGIYCTNSNPSLVNCIVSDNSGDGINGGSNLLNCIVSDNTGYGISGDATINYSDFYNNHNGNFHNCGQWVGVNVTTNANGDSCDVYSNIQLNPLFVDLSTGDYHLTSNSPCIDAGDPASPLDPDGTIADMGAFYYDQSGIIYPPLADFVADITEGYAPLTVNFTDLSTQGSGVIDEWYWDFGDGNNSSLQDPANEYLLPGIYTVSLTVTDENDSTDTETKIDYITIFGNDPPAPPINVQINIYGDDAIISWAEVDTTIFGDPINVDYYIVLFSEDVIEDSLFYFLGFTPDTLYTHYGVAFFRDQMFYRVESFVGTSDELESYVERYLRKPEGKYLIK